MFVHSRLGLTGQPHKSQPVPAGGLAIPREPVARKRASTHGAQTSRPWRAGSSRGLKAAFVPDPGGWGGAGTGRGRGRDRQGEGQGRARGGAGTSRGMGRGKGRDLPGQYIWGTPVTRG